MKSPHEKVLKLTAEKSVVKKAHIKKVGDFFYPGGAKRSREMIRDGMKNHKR